jgi:hypothetical protein
LCPRSCHPVPFRPFFAGDFSLLWCRSMNWKLADLIAFQSETKKQKQKSSNKKIFLKKTRNRDITFLFFINSRIFLSSF